MARTIGDENAAWKKVAMKLRSRRYWAGVSGFEPELQGFGDPPTAVILHPRSNNGGTDWRNRTGLMLRPQRSALPLS
jgi:hypothetical protein